MNNEKKPLLTLTDAAANRVKDLMSKADSGVTVSYTHLTLPTIYSV